MLIYITFFASVLDFSSSATDDENMLCKKLGGRNEDRPGSRS